MLWIIYLVSLLLSFIVIPRFNKLIQEGKIDDKVIPYNIVVFISCIPMLNTIIVFIVGITIIVKTYLPSGDNPITRYLEGR